MKPKSFWGGPSGAKERILENPDKPLPISWPINTQELNQPELAQKNLEALRKDQIRLAGAKLDWQGGRSKIHGRNIYRDGEAWPGENIYRRLWSTLKTAGQKQALKTCLKYYHSIIFIQDWARDPTYNNATTYNIL